MVDRLSDTDNYIDNVLTLRNEYAADIVSLWVEFGGGEGEPCGLASRIMDNVNTCYAEDGFNVVARTCAVSKFTFAHEMGHNMGARHAWDMDDTDGLPFTYNHGFKQPMNVCVSPWRTIMTTKASCDYCPRIPFWSNPNKYYEGFPMGVHEGTRDTNGKNIAADNSKVLNNTAQRVANFRLAYELTVYAFEGIGRVVPSFGTLDWSGYTALGRYKPDKVVTLSVIPGSAPFIGFYGEGCNGTQTCTVTMNSAKNVEARFYWDGG